MNRPVSVSRFEAKLRSILGAGGSNLLNGVEDHVSGLIVLENDRPEWGFGGGERYFGCVATDLGGAGLRYVALENPAASGVIIILDWAEKTLGGASAELWGVSAIGGVPFAGSLGTLGSAARDSRHSNVGAAIVRGGSNAGTIAPNLIHAAIQVSALSLTRQPIVMLAPGSGIIFESTTAATGVRYSLFWREVALEGSKAG